MKIISLVIDLQNKNVNGEDVDINFKINSLKENLDNILYQQVKGLQIRARADFIELGEKSTPNLGPMGPGAAPVGAAGRARAAGSPPTGPARARPSRAERAPWRGTRPFVGSS